MISDLNMLEIAADPFVQTGLLALVGALLTHVLLRHYPTRRLIVQITFFVALTVLLLHYGIIPYEVAPADTPVFERVFVALAKIIWWVNAAWVLTGCARVFLIFERRPREGRLIQDLVVATIYLGAGLSVVAYVFSAPVGTLIATSGVFAIILGLALQSTLSDVFSGIALNLSRPYSVGDWIVLDDGIEGRVVETNWRATHLVNATNDLVVLPNSVLAKARFTNLSSPNRSHGVKLGIRVVPTMAPSAISDLMHSVLLSSNSIAPMPAPAVQIMSLDAQAIEFELSFRVQDFGTAAMVKHEVYDLIYRHSKAAGLALAQPQQASAVFVGSSQAAAAHAPRSMAFRLLDAVPLFVSLSEDEKEALAATMKAIADLPREGGQLHRQTVEQWLGMARANKGNFVAAVNQGFDIWERECRRLIGAPHQSGALPVGANPMEVWLENWQRAVAAMTAGSVPGEPYRELVRRQTELVQQALLDGVGAWRRRWPRRRGL